MLRKHVPAVRIEQRLPDAAHQRGDRAALPFDG
jgi:hypothetical protein